MVLVPTHAPQVCLCNEHFPAPLAPSEGQCCLMWVAEGRAPCVLILIVKVSLTLRYTSGPIYCRKIHHAPCADT